MGHHKEEWDDSVLYSTDLWSCIRIIEEYQCILKSFDGEFKILLAISWKLRGMPNIEWIVVI